MYLPPFNSFELGAKFDFILDKQIAIEVKTKTIISLKGPKTLREENLLQHYVIVYL